ncbi:MAG TPA: S41 family peptidase [Vicinamibacteria bacterium]|nr:S41 family peptidase [Vicinamibacteria bacterium]
MHRLWAAPAVGLLSLLYACGGTSSQGSAPSASDCSVAGENAQILSIMQSWYYWYQTLPSHANAANYASSNALLDALRQQPLDRFSYITTQAANQSFYGAGQYVGYGLGFALSASNNLDVNQVFPGSPADQAGLTRGDTVTAVNGVSVPTLVANNQLDSALASGTPGVNKTFAYTSLQSQTYTVTLTSAVITQPTVGQVQVFDDGRERVGYFLFNSFIDPSNSQLDQAFAQFASQGVTHVVIDERYNGGGEVSVAQHLASLIAGNSYAGKSLATLTYNDKHTSQNETITFPSIASPLSLTQVFFITTGSSASASEFIINALRPFMDVVTVGAATFGKPVGEDGFNVCTDVLYPITFKIANVSGYGDYFNGLPATCPAADDLGHALGDPNEASLATALSYIRTQSCPHAAARPNASRATSPRPWARDGWRQLINAY